MKRFESKTTKTIANCACAGTVGGAVAGCIDTLNGHGHDSLRFLMLLVGEYGAACGISSAILGALGIVFARLTDVHLFWANTFAKESVDAAPTLGAPWLAYKVSTGLALIGYGVVMRPLYEKICVELSPPLVPIATGVASMSLVVATAIAIAVFARLLSVIVPQGERISLRLTLSPSVGVISSTLGFLLGGCIVGAATLGAMHLPVRLIPFGNALAIAIGAPIISSWCLIAFHFAAQAWDNREPASERKRSNPAIRYLLFVLVFPPVVITVGYFSLAKHLGYRPLVLALTAIITAIATFIVIRGRLERARGAVVLRLALFPAFAFVLAMAILLMGDSRVNFDLPTRSVERIPAKDRVLCEFVAGKVTHWRGLGRLTAAAIPSCVGTRVGTSSIRLNNRDWHVESFRNENADVWFYDDGLTVVLVSVHLSTPPLLSTLQSGDTVLVQTRELGSDERLDPSGRLQLVRVDDELIYANGLAVAVAERNDGSKIVPRVRGFSVENFDLYVSQFASEPALH